MIMNILPWKEVAVSSVRSVFDERKIQLEDVIREFELSSILVADAGLGTINSVVLTAEYMKAHSLPIKGIIFNHYHPGNIMEEDNIAMCQ